MASFPAALILRFVEGLASAFFSTTASFFPALALAHLAFWAAAILALPSALIPPFFGPLLAGSGLYFTTTAATSLRGRPRFLGAAVEATAAGTTAAEVPMSCSSSVCRASILSWRSAAWRSCDDVKLIMVHLFIHRLPHLESLDFGAYGATWCNGGDCGHLLLCWSVDLSDQNSCNHTKSNRTLWREYNPFPIHGSSNTTII